MKIADRYRFELTDDIDTVANYQYSAVVVIIIRIIIISAVNIWDNIIGYSRLL